MNMKILYLANIRLPTEKAHGAQVMHVCQAFVMAGAEVTLVIPKRINQIKAEPFGYYNIERNFIIKKLPNLDLILWIPKLGFWLQSFTFILSAFFYILTAQPEVIYSREEGILYFLSFFRSNLFWEAHRGETSFLVRRLLKKCQGIITISQGLKGLYISLGRDANEIFVAHDGVDVKEFDVNISQQEARQKLSLPQDKKIAMYIGHFHEGKGAEILMQASRFLPADIKVAIIGGEDVEVETLKSVYPNVIFLGYHPYRELPMNQKAADVLVIPNSAKTEIFSSYTSPLKLFAHMASDRPIVATGVPALLEVLDENLAVLVKPDDPKDLADGIMKVVSDPALGKRLASAARQEVQKYSWSKRAKNLISFIEPSAKL